MELGGIYGAQGHIFNINNKVAMAKQKERHKSKRSGIK
jgi:hypothetical protein